MAADSRATSNTTAVDGVQKITRLASNCCVGVAGVSSVGIPSVRDVIRELGLSTDFQVDVHDVARTLEMHLNDRLTGAAEAERAFLLGAEFILAGYLSSPSRPAIYAVKGHPFDRFIPLDQPEGYNKVGNDSLVSYYCSFLNGPPDAFPREYIAKFVHFIISETARTMPAVGGPLQMVSVASDSVISLDPSLYASSTAKTVASIKQSIAAL